MPNTRYDKADEAKRKAEEEAEKAKRRDEIKKQIKQLEDERGTVTAQIDKLKTEQLMLHSYQKMWEEKKRKYNGNEILSEVVIVNIFEGACADEIKGDFTACIKEMDKTYSKAGGLRESIGIQVLKLNEYVYTIDVDIRNLRVKLDFI